MGYTRIYVQVFLCLFYIHIRTYKCDLCDVSTFTYRTGQNITILDVKASEISALQTSCFKRIKLPGIVNATLSVETADFSSDIYWTYNSNYGTSRHLFYDEAYIYFGECPPTKHGLMKLREGFVKVFSSNELCIQFEPDTDFQHLGGHVEGGRVKIMVRVNVAVCNSTGNRTQTKRTTGCQYLCSASGAVGECNTVSAEKQPKFSSTASSHNHKSYSLISHSHGAQRSAAVITTKAQDRSANPSTRKIVRYTGSTDLATESSKTSVTVSSSSSTVASKQFTGVPTLSTSIVYILPASAMLSATTTVRHMKLTKYPYATIPLPSSTGLSQRTTPILQERRPEAFGLFEGLCVLGGSFLVIVIAITVACWISSRKKYCFRLKESDTVTSCDTNNFHTPTTNNKDLLWRDNWLVRYHNNPTFIQTESDIDSLPEGLFEHSHQNGMTICQYDSYDRTVEENPYDNPWPLVRLDSDFVRNTKKLEKELSQEGHAACETASDYNTIDTAYIFTKYAEQNKELAETAVENKKAPANECIATGTLCKKVNQNRTSYKRNETARPIKGIYDIIRMKRASSKSEKDSHLNSSTMKAIEKSRLKISGNINRCNSRTSDWCRDQIRSTNSDHGSYDSQMDRKEHTRMCSDCNMTFEEMIQHEIGKIEGVLGMEANEDFDRKGSMNDQTKKKEWTVNTLYAVVSQRGQASLPCGTSGTLQYPK